MNAEFFSAIAALEKEKGIPKQYMFEKITQALVTAYKRDNAGYTDNIFVELDEARNEIRMYVKKEVVELAEFPATEIALEDARKISGKTDLGDTIYIDIQTKEFGRIAAQTAKQVIIQGIREAERGMVFDEFNSREQEILTGTVTRVDPRSGAVSILIGSGGEKTEALLLAGEQIAGETYREGERIKVFVVEVRRSNKGPQVMISRTHPGLVKRLFELEVPEVAEGIVEIKSIAREAGNRTKLAVWSAYDNIDPVGACVGPRGGRVSAIVNELRGEKMDIIKYYEDPAEFVAAALSPADVISVHTLPDSKSCRVIVPDDQLSLAIGKEGQNARLAAKLTGFKIDIKPLSQAGDIFAEASEEQ